MAIKTKIIVRDNALAGGGKVASATIVDLQEMDFDAFCEYLAQDSTVGAADVSAVMKQLEKKLPLILGMGTKVQISAEGMVVRRYLRGHGFRYRLNHPRLPGKPDIVMRKYRTCIFINGCFWHGHEGCKYYTIPKTNTEFWVNRNKERDNEVKHH